ncbi:MAG: ATP-dependent helicase, partial [Candidatus Margulisbacteria bacterium]|nr:ATP-dependent helicase [Candidatus Margulisiibacteriota bacterium]
LASLELISERYDDIDSFLTEMSLEPPNLSQVDADPEASEDENLVLSTIHSAKGLEWHSVFILSVLDGYIPSFRSLGDLSQLEEERRLLYVALTRAKKGLYIMKPHLEMGYGYQNYAEFQFSKVSRFLEEGDLLAQFTEPWSLRDESHSGLDSRKYQF